jgi:hypothetical protein
LLGVVTQLQSAVVPFHEGTKTTVMLSVPIAVFVDTVTMPPAAMSTSSTYLLLVSRLVAAMAPQLLAS